MEPINGYLKLSPHSPLASVWISVYESAINTIGWEMYVHDEHGYGLVIEGSESLEVMYDAYVAPVHQALMLQSTTVICYVFYSPISRGIANDEEYYESEEKAFMDNLNDTFRGKFKIVPITKELFAVGVVQ